MINQSKVSAVVNHDYISYSDIKIRYRWNRGSGPLISLDHVRIRRPIESSCSWMLHRNPSLFLSSTEKGSFRITRSISLSFFFSFSYGNAMQKRSRKPGCFWWWKALFLCYVKLMKTRYLKVGNVRRRLSVSDGKIPMVGISLKAQTERINGLFGGYLRHFSANKPEGLELLDVAQCCYNLTTKKLCVELQPLRVGHGATASDAPHHCGRRGLAHQPTLPRGGRSATI